MKKFIKKMSLLLLATGVFLSACTKAGNSKKADNNNHDNKKLNVVTTIFPEYDIARAIGKDKINLEMLIPPGVDVHSFKPTPQDIKKADKADIFIYGGTNDDLWVNSMMKSIDTKKMDVIKLSDSIQQLEEETVEGMKDEDHDHDHEENHEHHDHDHEEDHEHHDHDHEEVEMDSHFWTSPLNAIEMVKTISNKLIEKDKKNATFYKENAENYIKKLQAVDKKLHDIVNNSKNKKIVIADRFPFRYLFNELGIEYRALFTGCSVECAASAGQIKQMVDYVKANNIKVVYHIEMGNGDMAKTVAKDSGAKVMVLNSIHTVSKDDFDKGVTYVDLMERNVEALKEGLN